MLLLQKEYDAAACQQVQLCSRVELSLQQHHRAITHRATARIRNCQSSYAVQHATSRLNTAQDVFQQHLQSPAGHICITCVAPLVSRILSLSGK